jgi:hypothetical protein
MKKLLALTMIGAFAAVATAAFAGDAPAPNPQQERMKTCNTKAGDKKGDERKAFMKDCLSAEKKTYDNKMAMCNAKTKGMTKEEGNKVRSDCMKAPS